MDALRRADLEAILDFLVDAGEFEFDEPFPPALIARLAMLIPGAASYQEIDVGSRRTIRLIGMEGPVPDDAEDEERYWRLGPCPLVLYRAGSGDLAATRMSDVMDRRRYVETALYREYFKPVDLEYMLDVGLPGPPGRLRSFLVFRGKGDGDFSVRDRIVFDALRPHFARLEAEAALRRRLSDILRGRDRDVDRVARVPLTTREREIVALVADGKTNAQIAADLWVAPSTVKKHLENVYAKLGVSGRTAAATYRGP